MYTNLENAYNDNSDELDKMAKKINKKKESLIRNEENEFDRVEKKWKNDINYFTDENNYSVLSSIDNNLNNYNENYKSYNNNLKDIKDITDNSLDSISIDSPTINSFIDSIKDTTIDSITNKKRKYSHHSNNNNILPIHKFISNISNEECSKDSNDIFSHIKSCRDCKKKLIKYISSNHNKDKYDNIDEMFEQFESINKNSIEDNLRDKQSLFSYFGTIENKEVMTIILLGIIIIVIIDFIMKPLNAKYTSI